MKGNEPKEEGGLTIILLIAVIIIIFLLLSYKYQKFDKLKIFHKDDVDHISEQIDSPDHISEVQTRLVGETEIAFNRLGIPDLASQLVTTLDPYELQQVEVENDAGETGEVYVCSNRTGRQPKYINKRLICLHGMELKDAGGILCCDTDNELPPEQIGAFGHVIVKGMDLFNDHPVAGTAAASFGMFMAYYVLPEKVLMPAAKLAFSKVSTIFSKVFESNSVETISRFASPSRALSFISNFGKSGVKAAEIASKVGSESVEENLAERAAGEAVQTTEESVEKNLAERATGEAVQTSEESAKIATEGAKTMKGAKSSQTGTRIARMLEGSEIGAMGGLMILQVCAEIIGFIMTQLDAGGFGQFQSNDMIKKSIKEYGEKEFIKSYRGIGLNPPYIFNLDSINSIPNLDEVPNLKNVYNTYTEAVSAYLMNLNRNLHKYISQQDKIILRAAVESGHEITQTYINSIVPKLTDRPEERDTFIFNYLKNHLDSDSLACILYDSDLTEENRIAISLNAKGVEEYNAEIDKLIKSNPNEENPQKIKISKYYRDLNSGGEIIQKALKKPFCQLRSLHEDLVEHICTEGVNPEDLAKQFPLRQAACCSDWCKEDIIKPKDYKVTYNIDTGVCNYNEEYCEYMGYSETEEGDILCEEGGCENSKYTKCKLSEGQEISSFVVPEIVVHEWARNPMAVVAGAAAVTGAVALTVATGGIAAPFLGGATLTAGPAMAVTGATGVIATGAAVGASAAACSIAEAF